MAGFLKNRKSKDDITRLDLKRGYLLGKLMIIILLTFVLSACNLLNTESTEVHGPRSIESGSTVQTIPEDMPEDFGFSIRFGVGKNNEINTFEDTVTKDLIEEGTATVNVTLTEEEMNEIYEKMKLVNIVEIKNFIPEPINGNICAIEPYEEDLWEILINGETITQYVSDAYCEPTNDTTQLIDLRNYVFSLIKSKEEYIILPESKGGYE